MAQYLFYYQRPEPATWVYMSSFLIVGIYFMFHRVWSVRNLDILMLLLLTPGLMLIYESYRLEAMQELTAAGGLAGTPATEPPAAADAGPRDRTIDASGGRQGSQWTPRQVRFFGYICLLSLCGLWLTRMLIDTTFFRRPLLEPNLTRGGLIFIGASLFAFLMANIFNGPPAPIKSSQLNRGPGYDPLKSLPDIATIANQPRAINDLVRTAAGGTAAGETPRRPIMKQQGLAAVSRVLLIIANSVLVLGMVAVGFRHFADLKAGVGAATLYLLLPYAAQMVGRVEHAIPGALLVLAVLLYRRPLLAGGVIGLAGGLVFYPLFLMPLWFSFYWQRGQRRFAVGVIISLLSLVIALALADGSDFAVELRQMFGTISFAFEDLDGIWELGIHPFVRVPVVVAFVALAFSFAFWPAQKSLATLLHGSAAIMIAAQFAYAYGGGLLMAWYLPLVLLTVFRPNLDDLVATQVVRPFRIQRRREPPPQRSDISPAA